MCSTGEGEEYMSSPEVAVIPMDDHTMVSALGVEERASEEAEAMEEEEEEAMYEEEEAQASVEAEVETEVEAEAETEVKSEVETLSEVVQS